MRHAKHSQRLSRPSEQRKALISGLVRNLILQERITTTHARAKEAQRLAEKLISLGKEGSLASRRRAFRVLQDRTLVKRLFVEIAPRFTGVPGGFTRVIHHSSRLGDGASKSVISFTRAQVAEPAVTAKPKTAEPVAEAPARPEVVKPKEAPKKPKGIFAGVRRLLKRGRESDDKS